MKGFPFRMKAKCCDSFVEGHSHDTRAAVARSVFISRPESKLLSAESPLNRV